MVRTWFAWTLLSCLLTANANAQQGQLAASPSLFAVFAALDAAGFSPDQASLSNHALRTLVRNQVLSAQPPVLEELRQFFAQHRASDDTAQISQYVSFGLASKGPPTFEYKHKLMERPPDVIALNGLEKLLARFWKEADLERLWQQAQPAYEEVIEKYHPPVAEMVMQASAYLRSPAEGYFGWTFQVVPELLAPPNHIQVRQYGTEFFIVLTPSAALHLDDIRQAYLQFLVAPLMGLHAAKLEKKRDIGELAKASSALPEIYKEDFRLLAEKSFIRALEARLSHVSARERMVEQAMREGFILTACFFEQLPAYEKQELAMRFYLGEMIDRIDLARESDRIAGVSFLESAPVRPARVVDTAARRQAESLFQKLEEAENLYSEKRFNEARAAYAAVLQTASDRLVQARCFYGLARIAARTNDPDSAEQLFLKTLELEPDPRTRAWTHVYLARLYKALAEPDLAKVRQHFLAALAIEEASPAARANAEAGLKEIENGNTQPR